MHELAAVQDMVKIALEKAQEAGSSRVTGLHFIINTGGHVTEESVQTCFDIAAQDTSAQGAQLFFAWNPPHYQCFKCSNIFEGSRDEPALDIDVVPCPRCGESALMVPPAVEFYLDSIDVE